MRVVRIAITTATVFVALAVLTGTAGAATFNFSSSVSTSNAGAPATWTVDYSSSSAATLNQLQIDMPPGMMHEPSSAATCPVAAFQADRCPSASTVGSVSSQILVLGLPRSFPGTIYRLENSPQVSEFEFGVVLRPALSPLTITGKLYLRDRVSFTSGGALRHSLASAISNVTVAGIRTPARLSRLTLRFSASNASGNLLYNSTSCAASTVGARGEFSDQTAPLRTAPYAPVNCSALGNGSSAGIAIDESGASNPYKKPTKFALLLGGSNRAPAGVTHEYHRVSVTTDVTQLGTWDLSQIQDRPACSQEEAAAGACPAGSQIGEITTGVEGVPRALGGAVYNSFPKGPKPVGVIELRPGVRAVFPIDLSTTADGRSLISATGLPQLPLTDTKIQFTVPALLREKPAICRNDITATTTVRGHNGGQTNSTAKYPPTACPPIVTFADSQDQDSDGDGFADDSLRPENFQVRYRIADGGNGVDESSARCELESADPSRAPKGDIKVIKDTEGGIACDLSNSGGDVKIILSVSSVDGSETVLESSYVVDSETPVLSGRGRGFYATPDISEEFAVTDDTMTSPQSEYTASCFVRSPKLEGGKEGLARIVVDRDSGRSKGFCSVDGLPDGEHELVVRVRDKVGHVAERTQTIEIDAVGPVIKLTDPRDQDSDEDGIADDPLRGMSFSVPFVAIDDTGVDEESPSCALVQNNPTFQQGQNWGKMPDGPETFFCAVSTTVIRGDAMLEISAASRGGHVTVLKIGVTIDASGPQIDFIDPRDADENGDGRADYPDRYSSFTVPVKISDMSGVAPFSTVCKVRAWDPSKKEGIEGVDDDRDGIVDRCVITDAPPGLIVIVVEALDQFGNRAQNSREFVVLPPPPPRPTVTLESPYSGQNYQSGSALSPSFAATGVGPISFTCVVDSVTVSSNCVSGQSISLNGFSSGPHTFTVTARDVYGQTASAWSNFLIGNRPPDYCIAIYPPPTGCPGGPGGPPVICLTVYPGIQPGCPGYVPPGGGPIYYQDPYRP